MDQTYMKEQPVLKLIVSMALPMVISMMVSSLYNIVDSIFVAKLSENALTAVSLAFPLQMLLIAVATGTGVGMNALLSRALGAKKTDEANKIASNAAFLYIISYIVFLILGFTVVKPFYASQIGNADVEIMEMGIDYLSTVMIFSMGLLAQICFERLLTSTGRTIFSMTSQLCGAVTNIILDPILIFGLIGFPKMGVTGAAVATVIGQCVGALVSFTCNHKFNPDVRLQFRGFRPDGRIIRTIYAIGIPSIIMQSIGSVMTYSMNRILITFSSTATAVFGVYFKLQSFFFMPVFGLNNGITPIIAFAYGMRSKKRIQAGIKYGLIYTIVLMILGIAITEIFPGAFATLFNAGQSRFYFIGAMRVISISFLFAGINVAYQGIYQALNGGMESLVISLLRQLVIILPLAGIFSTIVRNGHAGVSLIWWAFPITELIACLAGYAFLKRIRKTKVDSLK